MLQTIEAHPNWPLYANDFDTLPRACVSKSSMVRPFDITAQWREDWLLASVVNHTVVIDPAIWQPSFDMNQ